MTKFIKIIGPDKVHHYINPDAVKEYRVDVDRDGETHVFVLQAHSFASGNVRGEAHAVEHGVHIFGREANKLLEILKTRKIIE